MMQVGKETNNLRVGFDKRFLPTNQKINQKLPQYKVYYNF